MPQSPTNKEYLTFVKGIITEASPLTFPENASIDEQNFVLERSGSRRRRLGMEYEDQHVLRDTGFTKNTVPFIGISVHLWDNINENSELSFYVVQLGSKLTFYDASSDIVSSSQRGLGGPEIELPGDPTLIWQSASIGGRIILATGGTSVHSLEYNEEFDIIEPVPHGLLVRDQWGVDDGLDNDFRPTVLGDLHKYNLLNQGWAADRPLRPIGSFPYINDFLVGSDTDRYPSNSDLIQVGKDATDGSDFDAKLISRSFQGNTPSPKGHYILDLFDRGGYRKIAPVNPSLLVNGGVDDGTWGSLKGFGSFTKLLSLPEYLDDLNTTLATLPGDRTVPGVSVAASYAERVFYSGMKSNVIDGDARSPLLGHLVFFTQLAEAADKIGKCYQEADPTSEDQSDLISTDGGFIKIPEMSRCLKLVPYASSLVVFAENGVWEISGSEEGFKATNFQVVKVTDLGSSGANSIVEVEDRIYFFSRGGIYAISRDPVSLALQVASISATTIQTLFESFSINAITNASGTYDTVTKQVRWLLNDEDDYDGVTERFRYNLELIYDVVLEAFYPSRLPTTDGSFPYLAAGFPTPGFVNRVDTLGVISDADDVVSDTDNVVTPLSTRIAEASKTLYLAILPQTNPTTYKYTFSYYRDGNFEDWAIFSGGSGVDANAFLLTGYETGGDTQRQKQAVYITNHFLRTETGFKDNGSGDLEAIQVSSCLVQSQWDFANSAASNKFGPKFQAYRLKRNYLPSGIGDTFDYGHEVITTKSKLRGRGRALSLLFETEPRKDLIMLGWGVIFGVNTNV